MEQPTYTITKQMLSETFDSWREEFREILENHRREIQTRLEIIEKEIEKKSDKENVDILVRNIHDELRRHAEELNRLHGRVSAKMGTETMWKIVGLTLSLGTIVGGLVGFMLNVLMRVK